MAWLRARPRLGPVRAHCNAQLTDYCIGRARGRVITTGIAHGFAHVHCSAQGTGDRMAQSAACGMMTAIAHGLAPVYCGPTRRAPPTASYKASTGDMTAGITYGLTHVFGNVSGRR